MITESTIYWITRCTNIVLFFGVSSVVCIFVAISTIYAAVSVGNVYTTNFVNHRYAYKLSAQVKIGVCFLIYSLFAILCCVFIPSTKEMCAIKVIPAIANNENVHRLGEDVIGLAKDWLQELKPNKSNDK